MLLDFILHYTLTTKHPFANSTTVFTRHDDRIFIELSMYFQILDWQSVEIMV